MATIANITLWLWLAGQTSNFGNNPVNDNSY